MANRRWFYVAGLVLIVAGVLSSPPTGTVLLWLGFTVMVVQVPISVWYGRKRRTKTPDQS